MRAEPGAPAGRGEIPLCVPHLGGNEWAYVKDCLDTNWVSAVGAYVDRFEREVAARAGAQFGVATTSGSAALHVALLVAGIQPEDEVLVSTLTFIAPANAIRLVGAYPVFIDAEPRYWQMDPNKVAHFLDRGCAVSNGRLRNRETGRTVRAILPVHILGHPCDVDPLLDLARRYDLVVIEDATESLGALYKGRPVGHLGDVACFSFNGNKLITTGGGGMLVTDNPEWARAARYLTTQAKDDPVEYVHGAIGYNYRLTNVQAAMGCAQLERLDAHLAAKRRIAAGYAQALAEVAGIACPAEAPWAQSAWWLYTVLIDERRFGMDSRALLRCLGQQGIQTRPLWAPLHLNRPYRAFGGAGFPVAEGLARRALSLPSSVGLTAGELRRVVDAVCAASRSRRQA